MFWDTHRGIAQEVGERLFPNHPEIVAELVKFSTAPDYIEDILIGPTVTLLRSGAFGARFNSFTHFDVPAGNMKMRGYNMGLDGSIPKIARPKWVMKAYPLAWEDVLRRDRPVHPVQSLLDLEKKGIDITEDPWHFTFTTGANMADWVEKSTDPEKWAKAAGCNAHYACDSCIKQHVQGNLGNGHQKYEGKINDDFITFGEEVIARNWTFIEKRASELPATCRGIVELQAETTGAFRSTPTSEWAIKYGAAATLRVFQLFQQRYMK